ncbi:hypothetical protein OAU50_04670 [Planctomycetota bacterium]|nr:hypothetical protein [Planctomycetota bacterium]
MDLEPFILFVRTNCEVGVAGSKMSHGLGLELNRHFEIDGYAVESDYNTLFNHDCTDVDDSDFYNIQFTAIPLNDCSVDVQRELIRKMNEVAARLNWNTYLVAEVE